mmetsp:Transcript_1740/g.4714  ORF Transcript_1740/g.4714 Transcript_1740/m.4714 type:complete len:212 (-) Transcript_1740:71-706(-)
MNRPSDRSRTDYGLSAPGCFWQNATLPSTLSVQMGSLLSKSRLLDFCFGLPCDLYHDPFLYQHGRPSQQLLAYRCCRARANYFSELPRGQLERTEVSYDALHEHMRATVSLSVSASSHVAIAVAGPSHQTGGLRDAECHRHPPRNHNPSTCLALPRRKAEPRPLCDNACLCSRSAPCAQRRTKQSTFVGHNQDTYTWRLAPCIFHKEAPHC